MEDNPKAAALALCVEIKALLAAVPSYARTMAPDLVRRAQEVEQQAQRLAKMLG